MTPKLVAVIHRDADVRDRFAAALADAGHLALTAADALELAARLGQQRPPLAVAIVDASAVEGVTALWAREPGAGPTAASATPPVAVFASTVPDAATARWLAQCGVRAYVNDHSAPHQIVATLAPLLYRDSFNRRAAARVAVAMPVSYGLAGGPVSASATLLNIGPAGCALRPLAPLPVGALLQVQCHLPGAGRDLSFVGRVVWTDVRVGVGVQIEQAPAEDLAAIDAFVERHLPPERR